MFSIKADMYGELLRKCYAVKSPLYVYGGPGIGKTDIPRQIFPDIAKQMSRKFVEWAELTLEQKKNCISNPEKYWVFCDQRVGQMDSTDLRGIPNLITSDMLETIPMSWVIYFTTKGSAGTIFFDELNLAAPVVAGQAYQIINERTIADRKLSKDVYVFGAGNRAGIDQAYVQEMPFPLRDRFNEFELEPDAVIWSQWAYKNNINPHLIAFILWKNSYLYKVSDKRSNKSSTPRGIARASLLIGDNDVTSNDTHMMISISVGEAFATEFQAYTNCYKELNWESLFKNPKPIKKFTADKLFAIIGGLAEKYDQIDMATKVNEEGYGFEDIMKVLLTTPPDFVVVGLQMMKCGKNEEKWKECIDKYSKLDELIDKYKRFIF